MAVQQGDVLRATAEMSIQVDDLQNVLHYRLVSVSEVENSQALLDVAAVLDSLYDHIDGNMGDGVDFDQVRVQNITQDVLLGATAWPTLVAGGLVDDLQPRQAAALVTFPTAVPQTRAGIYFGGFTESANTTNGNITSVLLSNLLDLANEALTVQDIGGNLYEYVLVNREFGTVITLVSAIVHLVWRTQRRRRPGIGS